MALNIMLFPALWEDPSFRQSMCGICTILIDVEPILVIRQFNILGQLLWEGGGGEVHKI